MADFIFRPLAFTGFIISVSLGWGMEQPDPAGFPDEEQQKALRNLVETDGAVAERWRAFEVEARAALDDDPSPLREIIYEGRLDNDPERVRTVASLADMDKLDNAFDPAYWPVLAEVTGESVSRYPTWRSVLSSVGWVQEELSK